MQKMQEQQTKTSQEEINNKNKKNYFLNILVLKDQKKHEKRIKNNIIK